MSKYTRSWTDSYRMVMERKEKSARQMIDSKKEVMVVKNNKVVVIDKSDQKLYLSKGWSLAEEIDDFEPHMMYDPKTGKGYKANTMDDHLRMKKMGYSHDDPSKKEDNTNDKSDDGEGMDKVQPKAIKKKFKDRKDKDIDNDGDVDSSDKYLHKRRQAVSKSIKNEETIKEVDIFSGQEIEDSIEEDAKKLTAVRPHGQGKKQMKSANEKGQNEKTKEVEDLKKGDPLGDVEDHGIYGLKESIINVLTEKKNLDEVKSSSGYDLYHRDFSGAMQHAYAFAKKKGYVVDKDDIDRKVAMGPKRPSSGKTNKYILGTNKKQNVHIQVANLDNKRFELNMYIESVDLDEGLIQDLKKAEDLMGGSKTKEQGIQFVMDGMKVNKKKATQLVDKILKMKMSQKGKVTFKEDGHADVSSMKTKVKTAMMAIQKMQGELDKLPDDGDLPTWWTNKVAVAVDKLDGMSDYLDAKVETFEVTESDNLEEMKIDDVKKKLSKVKGLSKSVMDQMMTLPMPVLTTMVNQLSGLVASYHESLDESFTNFSVPVPKQTLNNKSIGGGKPIVVKARSTREAISKVAKQLGVELKFLKTGKVVKEEVKLDDTLKKIRKLGGSVFTNKLTSKSDKTPARLASQTRGKKTVYFVVTDDGYKEYKDLGAVKKDFTISGNAADTKIAFDLMSMQGDGDASDIIDTILNKYKINIAKLDKIVKDNLGVKSADDFLNESANLKEAMGAFPQVGSKFALKKKHVKMIQDIIKSKGNAAANHIQSKMGYSKSAAQDLIDLAQGRAIYGKKLGAIGSGVVESNLKEESEDISEVRMNDPKLIKMFDGLKRNDVIKLKIDSSISKGKELQNYVVKSKTKVRRGEVDKVTLILQGNPTGVKRFMYKKDGKVTFAIGDMAASIADFKEYHHVGEAMDDDMVATDSDRKAADKNIIMQLRRSEDMKGNVEITFADGKKKKVPLTIVKGALKKFNSLKKPAEKSAFQSKINKSYKAMLTTLKEQDGGTTDTGKPLSKVLINPSMTDVKETKINGRYFEIKPNSIFDTVRGMYKK